MVRVQWSADETIAENGEVGRVEALSMDPTGTAVLCVLGFGEAKPGGQSNWPWKLKAGARGSGWELEPSSGSDNPPTEPYAGAGVALPPQSPRTRGGGLSGGAGADKFKFTKQCGKCKAHNRGVDHCRRVKRHRSAEWGTPPLKQPCVGAASGLVCAHQTHLTTTRLHRSVG